MTGLVGNDGGVLTVHSLKEATQPLVEWDVRCIVHTMASIKVVAQTMQEAATEASKLPGVIYPLGVRRVLPPAVNDRTLP